jgi:N-formylglutamate deformylase
MLSISSPGTEQASTWGRALPGSSSLVLDSPHSGTQYPADFSFTCPLNVLRRAEDTHVEKLFDFAPQLGAAWVEAYFPRSYLDANRSCEEIDPELLSEVWPGPMSGGAKVRLGKGLIWRLTDEGLPIYSSLLSVREVKQRISNCWTPYHAALEHAIDATAARHGKVLHINCHSMPSVAGSQATEFPGQAHPDFVLGNRDDTTSSPELLQVLARHLAAAGHSVALNHPYKGVELVRRYSNPPLGRHSIQLEINRKLYMNEQTLELHDGFEPLRQTLRGALQAVAFAL